MWMWLKVQLLAALVAALLSILTVNTSSYSVDPCGQILRKPAETSPEGTKRAICHQRYYTWNVPYQRMAGEHARADRNSHYRK